MSNIPSVYLITDFFKLLKEKKKEEYDNVEKINLENKLFTQEMLTCLPKNLKELHIPNRSIVNPEYDFFNPEKNNNYSITVRNDDEDFSINDSDSEDDEHYLEVTKADTYFLDLYDVLPKNLKLLNLYHNELRYIEAFPPNLEELLLHKNIFLQKLPKLPDTLQLLSLSWTHLKELPNIPKSLKYLALRGAKVEQIDLGIFPDCFERLYSQESGIKKLYTSTGKFPKNLKIVDVSGSIKLDEIPKFPKDVFVLFDKD